MMKILVVDGSHAMRAQVVDALSGLTGVVVQGAVAALSDAVRAVDACPLDGIVTGSELPDGDVLGLIAAARRRCISTVVVYGADDTDRRREAWLEAGASHVVDGQVGELTTTLFEVAQLHSTEGSERYALLGRIAAGVAHDINNYLVAAEIALTYAERGTVAEARTDLRDVRASFDGIARLARSLTTYARGSAPTPEDLELAPLVQRTLDCFRRVIPEDVRIVIDVAPQITTVRGVASELEQLVLNLALSTCDAMPWGGTQWWFVDREGSHAIRLEVANSPLGPPADDGNGSGTLGASNRQARKGGGLGLGIVRSIVESHGGTLRAGRALGGGTKIVVVLPAALPPALPPG